MKKLSLLAAAALVAALGACAQSETANASAENGMAKKDSCCSAEAKAGTCTDKVAEAKKSGACCSGGEAKAGTCTDKAAQVK